jgi:hypothetical protein
VVELGPIDPETRTGKLEKHRNDDHPKPVP